jgi:hypothetical protein
LARRLNASKELGTKANLLRAIYLILPKIPDVEPDWLSKLEKISVIPNNDDLSFLLRNMSDTHGIHILKDRGNNTEGVPVYVDVHNPNAIPIAPFFLKRELTKIPEQFYSDSATANGRLSKGYLGLPPDDFIVDLFSITIDNSGILPNDDTYFTAQQIWPFVASALSVQGTPRPCWFLIRKCNELSKLCTFIEKAALLGVAYLRNNKNFVISGIQALLNDHIIDESSITKNIKETYTKSVDGGNHFIKLLNGEEEAKFELPENYEEQFDEFVSGEKQLVDCILALVQDNVFEEEHKYWIRQAWRALGKYEDRNAVIALMNNEFFYPYISSCRKLLKMMDFYKFGPSGGFPE